RGRNREPLGEHARSSRISSRTPSRSTSLNRRWQRDGSGALDEIGRRGARVELSPEGRLRVTPRAAVADIETELRAGAAKLVAALRAADDAVHVHPAGRTWVLGGERGGEMRLCVRADPPWAPLV